VDIGVVLYRPCRPSRRAWFELQDAPSQTFCDGLDVGHFAEDHRLIAGWVEDFAPLRSRHRNGRSAELGVLAGLFTGKSRPSVSR